MSRYQVEIAPVAEHQAATIQAWWASNRDAAPTLFLDELEAALVRLEERPELGRPYLAAGVEGMRRFLLPRTRYHVYFTVDVTVCVVRVHAIWHAARGAGPPL